LHLPSSRHTDFSSGKVASHMPSLLATLGKEAPGGQLGLRLVSASFHHSAHEEWTLPYPVEELLSWAWQRAEVEVCHREMKCGFGLRETQCWGLTQRSSL
jgi:hypothetical protein